MSQLKKVCFKLSFKNSQENRSELIRRVKNPAITEAERKLKKGYKEMAFINLSLAEMCFEADSEAQRLSEEKLTECE